MFFVIQLRDGMNEWNHCFPPASVWHTRTHARTILFFKVFAVQIQCKKTQNRPRHKLSHDEHSDKIEGVLNSLRIRSMKGIIQFFFRCFEATPLSQILLHRAHPHSLRISRYVGVFLLAFHLLSALRLFKCTRILALVLAESSITIDRFCKAMIRCTRTEYHAIHRQPNWNNRAKIYTGFDLVT